MKDLGEAKKIFGMEIKRDRKNIKLWFSQGSYGMSQHFRLSIVLCYNDPCQIANQ